MSDYCKLHGDHTYMTCECGHLDCDRWWWYCPRCGEMKVTCPYCQKPAELVTGKHVYPHRRDLWEKKFWVCEACDARCGCHKLSSTPLGRLANAELRSAKMKAHAAFDPIWKRGHLKRSDAYAWLAWKLEIKKRKCHIGMFDLKTCRKATSVSLQWLTEHGITADDQIWDI